MAEKAASFPFTEPTIAESITKLRYRWHDMDLLIEADRLTDAGTAELWFYHSNGHGDKLLHVAKVNLLSSTTMTQLGKRMITHSEDIPWTQILTCISSKTMEYQRRGEPGVVLKPSNPELNKPTFYIEPMIIRGVPNVIFGDKGVNKTTIALTMLGLIQVDWDTSPSGLRPLRKANTAMLDWEGTSELTNYTLARLVEGETIGYFEPAYLRCKQPLADDIERISNFLAESKTDVVLIDSLGQAAGSDKFDSAGKASALKFFECLRQLNVTSLIIAQNAKGEEGKKTIYGSTYYTYYARNIFEVRRSKQVESQSEMSVALIQQESNYTKKYEPLGFRIEYSDTAIKIKSEPVNLAKFIESVKQNDEVVEVLARGKKTVKEVADAIKKSPDQARVLLHRLKNTGRAEQYGNLWGLPSTREEEA